MDYKLKLPVTIDPESVKDITDKFLINLFLMRSETFPCRCEASKLRTEAIKRLKPSGLYFYTSKCTVGDKEVEYKYQTGEDIESDYSLLFMN